MISLQAIGQTIRSARMTRNYSQDYLGRRLGISQNAYSKIELGKTEVTLTRLSLIAEVLEVDLLELVKHAITLNPMQLVS
jgi:transcriptional regulator with XRE-family HTH domain